MNLFEAFEAFPEVTQSIIIKADVCRFGVRFSQLAREAIKQTPKITLKGSQGFSYNRAEPAKRIERIPQRFRLEDETPEGTLIQVRLSRDTPYEIDFRDNAFELLWNGKPLSKVKFTTVSRYSRRAINGIPMPVYAEARDDQLFISVMAYCERQTMGMGCLYCDINSAANARKRAGVPVLDEKDPDIAADVAKLAFYEGKVRHINIGGGTIVTEFQGKKEVDYYGDWVGRFLNKLGTRWPSMLQIAAQDDEGWKKLHSTGLCKIGPNIEVWDKRLFEIICPGKAKSVGYDEWIKRTIRAVDFWGPGNVHPSFVCGVEMAQPFGFKDVDEAVASTLSGHDFLMSNGVLPRMGGIWCIEPGSKLAGQTPPPLEFYIKLGKGYLKLREKYGFADRAVDWHCWRCSLHGLEHDFLYWHGTGLLSRKAEQIDKSS